MLNLYLHAKLEYLRMLKLPMDKPERLYGQSYMGFLRDFISVMDSKNAETIQGQFERAARQ